VTDGWQIKSIFHFTVNATNFERSLAFYQAVGERLAVVGGQS